MHSEVYKSILEIHPWSPFAAITKGMVPWPHDLWASAPPWRLGAPNAESRTWEAWRWWNLGWEKENIVKMTLHPCQSQRLRYWPDMMKYVDYTNIFVRQQASTNPAPERKLGGPKQLRFYDRCFAQWLTTGHKKINLRLFRPTMSYLAMISRKSI